jgi:sigma-B regulation protein RsbU (phosphoserine phosphatase)
MTAICCIDLVLEMTDDRLIMTFKDRGKPFNPLAEIAAPDLTM